MRSWISAVYRSIRMALGLDPIPPHIMAAYAEKYWGIEPLDLSE